MATPLPTRITNQPETLIQLMANPLPTRITNQPETLIQLWRPPYQLESLINQKHLYNLWQPPYQLESPINQKHLYNLWWPPYQLESPVNQKHLYNYGDPLTNSNHQSTRNTYTTMETPSPTRITNQPETLIQLWRPPYQLESLIIQKHLYNYGDPLTNSNHQSTRNTYTTMETPLPTRITNQP
jgi:hypothetical protein